MDELQRQVRRAQRRLALQRLAVALGWCWFVGLLAAAALIAVDKFHCLGIAAWGWAVGALGVGLLAALGWAIWTWRKPLDAAIEIDRRYHLKERVSSTLAMPADLRASEAGRALVDDALARVKRIDVAEKFALRPPRQLLLPLLPGIAAVLVAMLVNPAANSGQAAADSNAAAASKQQVKKSGEVLLRKLADRRKEAQQQGLKDATALLKKLEEGSRELSTQPDREKAMIKLNDLSRQLHERRQALGGAEKIKQQLEQLQKIGRGPADKLAQALSRGDFKKAAEELQKLKKQLADKQLDAGKKEELAKQLQQVEKKLKQMADAAQAAQGNLQKQIDQLRRDGQPAEADKLQEQLDKLLAQAPQMQQMQDLANKLGKCSKCLGQGGKEGEAAEALDQLQAGLDQLQKQADELKALDGAMEQLSQAREEMSGSQCAGMGDEEGKGKIPGPGLSPGRGQGARPEKKTDTALYDSQVRQKVGRGAATVTDLVNGPNVKGKVEAEVQQQFDTARRGSTDPLSGRHLPRKHGEQAREYFDRLREGK